MLYFEVILRERERERERDKRYIFINKHEVYIYEIKQQNNPTKSSINTWSTYMIIGNKIRIKIKIKHPLGLVQPPSFLHFDIINNGINYQFCIRIGTASIFSAFYLTLKD